MPTTLPLSSACREALAVAQEAARQGRCRIVEVDHLLLAVGTRGELAAAEQWPPAPNSGDAEGDETSGALLSAYAITPAEMGMLRRQAAGEALSYDERHELPLAQRVHWAIRSARIEARMLGAREVGREHLLIGALHQAGDTRGGRALAARGVTVAALRRELRERREGPGLESARTTRPEPGWLARWIRR